MSDRPATETLPPPTVSAPEDRRRRRRAQAPAIVVAPTASLAALALGLVAAPPSLATAAATPVPAATRPFLATSTPFSGTARPSFGATRPSLATPPSPAARPPLATIRPVSTAPPSPATAPPSLATAQPSPATTRPSPRAARPCPRTGVTLAVSRTDEGVSRIWRTRGWTWGCTTIDADGGRPERVLLSRRPVSRVRLDGATAAWTAHATGSPARARRVSAIDLTDGHRFLDRRRALPAADAEGAREREATVDQLRVLRGAAVGWIAGGSTVVIAVEDPDDVELVAADGTTSEILLSGSEDSADDGYAAVAATYPSTSAGDRSLRRSLAIATDDADPDDSGRYTTTWSWSPDGVATVRAVMTGTRD